MATNFLAKLEKINRSHKNKTERLLEKAHSYTQHCLELVLMAIKDYQDATAQERQMIETGYGNSTTIDEIVSYYDAENFDCENIDDACEDLFNFIDKKFNGEVVDDDDVDDDTTETDEGAE